MHGKEKHMVVVGCKFCTDDGHNEMTSQAGINQMNPYFWVPCTTMCPDAQLPHMLLVKKMGFEQHQSEWRECESSGETSNNVCNQAASWLQKAESKMVWFLSQKVLKRYSQHCFLLFKFFLKHGIVDHGFFHA